MTPKVLDAPTPNSRWLEQMRRYYSVETLEEWITDARTGKLKRVGKAQVARWQRVLAALKNGRVGDEYRAERARP